jgi:parvulin-like peptidyl-prolyl isomerase
LHQSFLKKIESEIIWSKIVNEIIKPKITISEIELQEFFEQNHLVNDNKKFLIYEIVLPNSQNSFEFAKRLLLDLKDGADFKELIKQFSSSASLERNGEIGWVSQNEIDSKIYDAISKLNKNDYSEVLLLKDGYHIFKLEDIKYSHINAKKVLFNNKLENLGKGYIVDLRRRSYIELY